MTRLHLYCPSCKKDLPLPPHACPDCGSPMIIEKAKSGPSAFAVLLLLFLVLGPLGLGVLWRNEHFTRGAKWALTVIVLAYTVALVYATWMAVAYINNAVANITGALSGIP